MLGACVGYRFGPKSEAGPLAGTTILARVPRGGADGQLARL
jgi:hypothetical protein